MDHALILAYYYPPEITSGAARPNRFVRYLTELGWVVKVVSSSDDERRTLPGHPGTWRVPDSSTANSAATGLRIRIAGAVERYLLPYRERLPWVPAAVEAGSRLIREHGISVIVSTSPPIATHLAALQLKKRFGIRWIADFRDPLVGNPFRTAPRAHLYDPMVEKVIFQNADELIANTAPVADQWRSRYPGWARKCHVIWNGYDPAEVPPAVERCPGVRRILTHTGSLYGDRHPKVLLDSIERLIAGGRLDPSTLAVRLIGPMESLTVATTEAPFSTLTDQGCLEAPNQLVSREEAARETAKAHYLLLLDLNSNNTGLQVPAKIFEYIRSGQPVLAFTARQSSVRLILERSGIPHVCIDPASSPAEVDRSLIAFLEFPPVRSEPSGWFIEQFDGRRQTATLSRLMRGEPVDGGNSQ